LRLQIIDRPLRKGGIKDKAVIFTEKTLEKALKTRSGPWSSPPQLEDAHARGSTPPPGNKPLGAVPAMNPVVRSRKILRDGTPAWRKKLGLPSKEWLHAPQVAATDIGRRLGTP
jgi:hypothetical protein